MSILIEPHGRLRWAIRATYFSRKLRYAGKHTPGLKWLTDESKWVGLADAVDACAQRLRKEMKLVVQGDVPAACQDPILTYPLATKGLFDYQARGAEFLVAYAREGAILADAMGLGKTAQALRAARALGGKTLVVCPAMVRMTWKEEAEKWWSSARVGFLDGGLKSASEEAFAKATSEVDLLIVHYDIFHAWAEFILGWPELGILDEAHYLISDKARRSKAIKRVFEYTPHRFALTGTPMMSRPKDMWNMLDTLYPGRFGRFFSFCLSYAEAHQEQVESKTGSALSTKVFWKFDGASNLPELRRRMSFLMLRRTKSQVAHELPPMRRQVIDMVVPKNKIVTPILAFKSETALRRALTLAADGKLPQVVHLVVDHANGMDHRVIVWCWRRGVAETVANSVHKLLPAIRVQVVHGGQTFSERRKRIAKQPDVLCATMDSIGVGINLIEYDTQVFAELSWLPSTLSQCEARPHRHGQTRKVLSQFCIARGTCDEWILEGVIKKLDLGENLGLGSDDRMLRDLNDSNMKKRQEGLRDLYERIRDNMQGAA